MALGTRTAMFVTTSCCCQRGCTTLMHIVTAGHGQAVMSPPTKLSHCSRARRHASTNAMDAQTAGYVRSCTTSPCCPICRTCGSSGRANDADSRRRGASRLSQEFIERVITDAQNDCHFLLVLLGAPSPPPRPLRSRAACILEVFARAGRTSQHHDVFENVLRTCPIPAMIYCNDALANGLARSSG